MSSGRCIHLIYLTACPSLSGTAIIVESFSSCRVYRFKTIDVSVVELGYLSYPYPRYPFFAPRFQANLLKEADLATVFLRAGASNQEIESKAPTDPPLGQDIVFAWLSIPMKSARIPKQSDT